MSLRVNVTHEEVHDHLQGGLDSWKVDLPRLNLDQAGLEGPSRRTSPRMSPRERKEKEEMELMEKLALHDPNRGLVKDLIPGKGRGIKV